jgi:heme-degrading monooxygenase HmoA
MPFIAHTPEPPYYAVIFTSINAGGDHDEHTQTYRRLVAVAESYHGFLGIEPARNADGSGVAAIYWADLQSIAAFSPRSRTRGRQEKRARDLVFSLHDSHLPRRA